jgi:hypothetical protein
MYYYLGSTFVQASAVNVCSNQYTIWQSVGRERLDSILGTTHTQTLIIRTLKVLKYTRKQDKELKKHGYVNDFFFQYLQLIIIIIYTPITILDKDNLLSLIPIVSVILTDNLLLLQEILSIEFQST